MFFVGILLLEPFDAAELPDDKGGDEQGANDDERHAPSPLFHAVEDIHAEDAGDERGKHQDDADARHAFHHLRKVVVDGGGVGFHRGVEDVRVDIGHLSCLIHLNGDVFDEIGIKLVHWEFEFEFGKEGFVATNGGDEVGQTVLQTRQPDEVFVVNRLVQTALGLFDEGRNLLQPLQIPHRSGEEESEGEIHRVGEPLPALLLIGHKVDHHVRFIVAHRHTNVLVEDNAQRDGGMWRAGTHLLDVGDAEDDERPALFVFVTRALVLVSDVV